MMLHARRLIGFICAAVGLWTMTSFAAVMIGAPHAAFWTSSLMWALLASMLLFPALLMAWLGTDTGPRPRSSDEQRTDEERRPEPFTDEPSLLWPEPQDAPQDEWPYNREDVQPRRTETEQKKQAE
jgi:hypothetical protein